MRQRGVALVVVLLLLAIAVLVAAQVAESLEQGRTRTENVLLQEQAWAYLLSAEALGLRALQADLEQDRRDNLAIDACDEAEWALALGPLPWDNGVFTVSLQDLQGRYNLNNIAPVRDGQRTLDRLQLERLKRLLRNTLPEADAADALAEEAADWTDSNTLVDGLGGAEDTEYSLWRTSNQMFAHVSELRALRSATAALWRETDERPRFDRYITALPEGTRVNVNTAPPEVLQALAGSLDAGQADAIVQARAQRPFETVDAFMALPALAGLGETERQELKDAIDVASEYFQVAAQVEVGGRTARLASVVYRPRQGGALQVVMRDLGSAFLSPEGACNPGWVPPEEAGQE